ncbi:MAG: hypothetical protein BWY79_01823 [Actinobacteria bacterium ADurb.Bin444]|nr:MAG: hypothetical protein BWY79_01823 [Actinobacteria bacterium ADurb.Bin444]
MSRADRAEGLGANWPQLAAYIREMAEEESEIHGDDGEAD